MNVSVIIAASGKSTRMCGIDKKLLSLDGIPVIIRSIMAFDAIEDVSEIIVVTSSESISEIRELIGCYSFKNKILVTEGGSTRQQSVFNGFKKISENCDFIAVHDGARPLVSSKLINSVFADALKYKASTLGVPVKDTIKEIDGGFISGTPERSRLFITQTPQVFEKDLYEKGVENAISNNFDFTDDCQLIEAIGAKVFMTVGEYSNIKITTPEDIKLAELFLNGGF